MAQKVQALIFSWKRSYKISRYFEILFGDPILCPNRFCSSFFSDCLFITMYSDENISLEIFAMSLLEHLYLRRVKQIIFFHVIKSFILLRAFGENYWKAWRIVYNRLFESEKESCLKKKSYLAPKAWTQKKDLIESKKIICLIQTKYLWTK